MYRLFTILMLTIAQNGLADEMGKHQDFDVFSDRIGLWEGNGQIGGYSSDRVALHWVVSPEKRFLTIEWRTQGGGMQWCRLDTVFPVNGKFRVSGVSLPNNGEAAFRKRHNEDVKLSTGWISKLENGDVLYLKDKRSSSGFDRLIDALQEDGTRVVKYLDGTREIGSMTLKRVSKIE